MEYTVVIEKRHCEGRGYASIENCPLCAAIREQLPFLKLLHVGGTIANTEDGIDYGFRTCNSKDMAGDFWDVSTIADLMADKIKSVRIILKKLSSGQEVQECDATKLIVAPSVWENKTSELTNLIPEVLEVSDLKTELIDL